MKESIYKVYIKTDENGNITDINSDIFLSDFSDWTEIDEGTGDRYAHAQNNYFEKPLIDDYGNYHYKFINGKIEEQPEITEYIPSPKEELVEVERQLLIIRDNEWLDEICGTAPLIAPMSFGLSKKDFLIQRRNELKLKIESENL